MSSNSFGSNSNSNSFGSSASSNPFNSNPNPFNSSTSTSANPFNSSASSNPFNSNPFNSSASSNPFNSSTSTSANPFNSSTSTSANPFNSNSFGSSSSSSSSSLNANSYSGLSPEFRSCIRASSMSSSSSGIPGDWHGPIDSSTGYKLSNEEIASYKLTECQKLIQEIGGDIRNILVDYENLPEGFDIKDILELFKEDQDFKTLFDNNLSEDDKRFCGISADFKTFIESIFRSFLRHPNSSFFGEETSIQGFNVKKSEFKTWEKERDIVYNDFYKELFPSSSQNTSTTAMDNTTAMDDTDPNSVDEYTPLPKLSLNNSSASLQMISSVTQSACNLLPQVYTAIFNKIHKMQNVDINAKIGQLSGTPDFNQAGRDMRKTQDFILRNKLLIDKLTASVGTVDIIHDVDNIANTQLASITEFSNNNKGIIGKGGQCNPKLLHKLIDNLFIELINSMITAGITDVKAPEYITLNEEDVMIYILACILERVEITMSESDLLKKELFWYESGIKWEGMISFCDFFDKQIKIKQDEILHKACSISRKQIDDSVLYAFIAKCKETKISFMFKQLSLCNFDAGPSTGSVGISAGLITQVGIDRDDVCLICNKTDGGKFYWICCVYNRDDNSTLIGLKERQPKAIFFGDNSASIDSLKIALNAGIVPNTRNIFGDDTHFRCANANNVTIPFWTGSYSDFLLKSSLDIEVDKFIHLTTIDNLKDQTLTGYIRSPIYSRCQMFLSTSSSDVNINCVLVIKTSGDCIQECVQKEYYLREPNDMGQGYNAGIFVAGKNIAVDFTVDSFVGKRKFERYSTGGGNNDGTCPGIFQQQSGHGAKYSLPIGLFQNPQDKATAFIVKIFGFQSLLNTVAHTPGNGNFNKLCLKLFATDDIELGRIDTVVNFIQDVNQHWLDAIDLDEIEHDIFSEFFYKLLCFQQEINIELMKKTIQEINEWNDDMNILLSMPTVDHIIRDDVSNDYENNSENVISEIFGDLESKYPGQRLWITGLTSNGLECRFLFNNDSSNQKLEAAVKYLFDMLNDQEDIGIERIMSSNDIYLNNLQLQDLITSLNSDQINAGFTILSVRNQGEGRRLAPTWCLTAAYKIPAGLESLISILSQQKTLGMSNRTLDELKIRINELCSSSVNTLTMRASRLRVNTGVESGIELQLDVMLTSFLKCLDISGDGADILEEGDITCINDSSNSISSSSSSSSSSNSNISSNISSNSSTKSMDNTFGINTKDDIDLQTGILGSFNSERNEKRKREGGGSKTRKRIKKYRNTRRKTKHYNKRSRRHYTKKHYTRKHYTKKHYTKKHYTKK